MLDIILFIVIGLHGWLLVFRLPHTLKVMYNAFHPNGYGIPDDKFWAFSGRDAGIRPWYNKIARDYFTQGRFGYVWDDGLGMELGNRIYNNFATYRLLYWLKSRRMMAAGYAMVAIMSAAAVGYRFNLWAGLAVGILVAGSPLIVTNYTHLGKPEMFWWGSVIPFVVLAFTDFPLLAGLIWSFIAFVNLPVAALITFLLGPSLFVYSISSSSFFMLTVGAFPGVVKTLIRLIPAMRSGYISTLTSEQKRLWKRPWYPLIDEILWLSPFALSILCSGYSSSQTAVSGLIIISCIGLYWANYRILYMNDPQSFHMALFVIGLGYALSVQSELGLAWIMVMCYTRPVLCQMPFRAQSLIEDNIWRKHWKGAWLQLKAAPSIKPISLPKPDILMNLFSEISDGSRIIFESDGDPRTESKFRKFWQWTEEFLPNRQIDLVNEMYLFVEPELMNQYLKRFNAEQMTAEQMKQLCEVLGVSYVIAYSSETVFSLQNAGFEIKQTTDLEMIPDFRELIEVPSVVLTLLKYPNETTVLEPAVTWKRKGNELMWNAVAGQSYIVRYRYSPKFKAYQDNNELPVEPVRPIKHISLTFMRVNAETDGNITLRFYPANIRTYPKNKKTTL